MCVLTNRKFWMEDFHEAVIIWHGCTTMTVKVMKQIYQFYNMWSYILLYADAILTLLLKNKPAKWTFQSQPPLMSKYYFKDMLIYSSSNKNICTMTLISILISGMKNTQPLALPMEGTSFVSYRNTIFPVVEDLHDANEGK